MVTETQARPGGFDAGQVWLAALEELRFQLTKPGYETWLSNAVLLGCEGGHFTIGVPTRLARDWLTERYVPLIVETLSAITTQDPSSACREESTWRSMSALPCVFQSAV